ncbi:MAG: hypothetical protein E7578_04810, partial [Ruminococcaceae bacterium]|nr:hypothetical protein [Oscillospiraceae bacterium]
MKKLLSFVLSLTILMSMSLPIVGGGTSGCRSAGDVNSDGKINLSDASLLLKHISKWEGFSVDTDRADILNDEKINLSDVSMLMKYIAGWSNIHLGHNYSFEVVSYPECQKNGLGRYTCNICKDSYEKEIEWTCSSPDTCETCLAAECAENGHIWSDGSCTRCKKSRAYAEYEDLIKDIISSTLAGVSQLTPEFANDISECTDTSKLYVLPDGYIYAYKRIIYPGGVPQFTNQVDPSTANGTSPDTTLSGDEWLNGYRIATKAISARKGIVVTDLIPAKNGDVIRIKGFDTSANTAPSGSTAYGEFRVIALTSSGAAIATEIQPATPKATSATTGKLEQMNGAELENGIYCFNVSSSVFNVGTSNVTYLRVCGYPEGGNSDGV